MISFSSQTVRAWKEDEYDPRTMVLQIEKDKYLLQTDAKLGTHKIYGEDAQDEEPPVVLVDEHEYNDGPLPFTQAGAQASGYEYVDGAINDKTLSHVYVQAGFQAATDEEGPPPPLPPLPAWCSQPASRSPSATKQAAALTINVDNDGDGKDEDEENGYMVPQTLTPEYEMAILTQSREMTRGAAAFKTAPAASAASAASLVVHGQSHEIMSSGSCQPISPMETRMEMQAFCLPKPSKQPSYATVAEVPPPKPPETEQRGHSQGEQHGHSPAVHVRRNPGCYDICRGCRATPIHVRRDCKYYQQATQRCCKQGTENAPTARTDAESRGRSDQVSFRKAHAPCRTSERGRKGVVVACSPFSHTETRRSTVIQHNTETRIP